MGGKENGREGWLITDTVSISAIQLRLIPNATNNVRRWLEEPRTIAGSAQGSAVLGALWVLLDKQALESRPLSRAGDVDYLLYAVNSLPG